jgi:hypothetical protein
MNSKPPYRVLLIVGVWITSYWGTGQQVAWNYVIISVFRAQFRILFNYWAKDPFISVFYWQQVSFSQLVSLRCTLFIIRELTCREQLDLIKYTFTDDNFCIAIIL